jgi:hypothetical protein
MKLHSSGLGWTKIDKINTTGVLLAHKTPNKTPVNTIYRLLDVGNLATNVGSFFDRFHAKSQCNN